MDATHRWITSLFVFLFGLEFGSFANVCIYRWPRSASVMRPRRSFCPWCSHQISWSDNIPLLSFVLLKGRCRQCRSPISARYPLVELTVGLLWVAAFRAAEPLAGPWFALFVGGVFAFLFVVVVTSLTDLDWRLIPDEATAALAIAGLVSAAANPLLGADPVHRVLGSAAGLAVGGGLLWLIGALGSRLFGRDAMGGGDIKLLGAMGTVLGWKGTLSALFLAAIAGGLFSLAGLVRGRLKRGQYIPFGPFLNVAGIFVLFALIFRDEPWHWLDRIWM